MMMRNVSRTHCADILFVDKHMPKMSGLEFIEHMESKGCKGLTRNKVVMSGALTEQDRQKAKSLGCIVVNKPITLAEVDTLIEEMKQTISLDRRLAEL